MSCVLGIVSAIAIRFIRDRSLWCACRLTRYNQGERLPFTIPFAAATLFGTSRIATAAGRRTSSAGITFRSVLASTQGRSCGFVRTETVLTHVSTITAQRKPLLRLNRLIDRRYSRNRVSSDNALMRADERLHWVLQESEDRRHTLIG